MKQIIIAGILVANLLGTASAALAGENGYHTPFYETSPSTDQAHTTTSGTAISVAAIVAGPAPLHCPYCALRLNNMGR